MKRDRNKYPKGWNLQRVREVIAHYDTQTEDEAIAEADAAWENSRLTLIPVPVEMADEVRELIARRSNRLKVSPRAPSGHKTSRKTA